MKKIVLNLIIIFIAIGFNGCADKDSNLTSSDIIGCRMMELQGSTIIITAPLGALIQKTGESFKDDKSKRDLAEVCRDVRIGGKKKFNNLSSEKNVATYENKLNNCIKSHGIDNFDAKEGTQWNREDIKEQLKDCHIRIKNGESEFAQKIVQDEIIETQIK